ncbi:unnamed protein product [Linum tenue]|uniref:gibberellin 3beta-dioxygenase n=1 Tax=Linum tenue TaxID=586396 RepID=A0AAV0PUS3_9ROSI|nr:unnamed protein product [Linum tenue]
MPSKLADAFRSHPVDIQPKNLHDLKELPDSYQWSADQDRPEPEPAHHEPVPVIDLSDPNALEEIGHACTTWGVFQVVNHGVPAAVLDRMEDVAKSFFSLPAHQKLKAARSPDGISGYGLARISSFFPKLMWSEGFTMVGSPLEHFHTIWPHHYTRFCDSVEEYDKQMQNLAQTLMWLMLGSLGITKEDLNWANNNSNSTTTNPRAAIQLNHYPACPDPDRAMGLAPHTDSTLVTILHQSNTSGLQVLRAGGGTAGWVTVPPIRGGLVVHIGDLLHILSNGLCPSVVHRAVVNRDRNRISIAYLHGPPSNVRISPVQKLVGPSQPQMYRAVTWTEYLGTKAKHFDKALSSVRLCAAAEAKDHNNNNNNNGVQVG